MSYFDELKGKVRDQIFEKEPPKPAPVVSAPTHPSTPRPLPSQAPVPYVAQTDTPTNGSLYKKLLSRTDFDSTPTGVTINKYLAPFASLPMPEAMKLKAAVAQASAQEKGITSQGILAVFDDLKNSLQTEAQKFNTNIDSLTDSEVTHRASKISDIDKQIAALQQQKMDEQNSMFTSPRSFASMATQTTLALDRSLKLESRTTKY
jgi:hypothetical protein